MKKIIKAIHSFLSRLFRANDVSETIYTVDRAIKEYTSELQTSIEEKSRGRKEMFDGEKQAPIDEIINHWRTGLTELVEMKKNGVVDAEKYNY